MSETASGMPASNAVVPMYQSSYEKKRLSPKRHEISSRVGPRELQGGGLGGRAVLRELHHVGPWDDVQEPLGALREQLKQTDGKSLLRPCSARLAASTTRGKACPSITAP